MNFLVSYVFVNLNKYVSDYDYLNDEFLFLESIFSNNEIRGWNKGILNEFNRDTRLYGLFSKAYDLKYILA